MCMRTRHDPDLTRNRVLMVESGRIGANVRQKILRQLGVAHSVIELAYTKHLAARPMVRLGAARSPQME